MAFNLLFTGILNFSLVTRAQESGGAQEQVPAPHLVELHRYNTVDPQAIGHEGWSLNMDIGDTMLGISASNMTFASDGTTAIQYEQNTGYLIGGINYIASLQMQHIAFIVGNYIASLQMQHIAFIVGNQTINQTITAHLTNCASFDLKYSPVQYNGTIPGYNCNITFHGIQVYPGTSPGSTFDFTLIHYVTVNWTQTTIQTEALFDFSNTKFYSLYPTEFSAGEPFTTEIHYLMFLEIQTGTSQNTPITPTGQTDTSLEYNITRENGVPVTIARLGMNADFTICNESGTLDEVGYSSMSISSQYAARAVTQGFPGLFYQNITSLRSDPEIIVNYDRIGGGVPWFWVLVAAGGIGVISVALFVKKKKRAKTPESAV